MSLSIIPGAYVATVWTPSGAGVSLAGVGGSGEELQWQDEFAEGSDLVGQEERITITGALVIQASAQQAGRRMTLVGGGEGSRFWGVLTRAEVESLRSLASVPGQLHRVTLADGRWFDAMFRRDGVAVEARPIQHRVPHESGDHYLPTIRLVLV